MDRPTVILLLNLADARRSGQSFDQAWPDALAVALGAAPKEIEVLAMLDVAERRAEWAARALAAAAEDLAAALRMSGGPGPMSVCRGGFRG
jgi:hypothetical protein